MAKNNKNDLEYEDLVQRISADISAKASEVFDSFLSEKEDEGVVPGDKSIEILDAMQAALTLALVKFMTINAAATQEGTYGKHTREDELLKLLGVLTFQASDFIYGFLNGKEAWPVVKTVKYN